MLFLRKLSEGLVDIDAFEFCIFEQFFLAIFERSRCPGLDSSFFQTFRSVGHNEVEINTDDTAEAFTGFAGA